jgi:ABC-type uncharacterized transport system involved in gliding motility auxiliary subunit
MSVEPRLKERGGLSITSREEEVLKVLSNPVGLRMFKLIGNATLTDSNMEITSHLFLSQTRVTKKQFYSNMSKLVSKTGLISRQHGRYVLSNYGKVVFHSLSMIERGSKHFWALKALDKDELSARRIPSEQIWEIGSRLIEDKDILKIVCEPMMMNGQKKDILYGRTYD